MGTASDCRLGCLWGHAVLVVCLMSCLFEGELVCLFVVLLVCGQVDCLLLFEI